MIDKLIKIRNNLPEALKNRKIFTDITLFMALAMVGVYTSISIFNHFSEENVVPVTGEDKLLPIYSVDTTEKKVAISFDAAWGNGCLLENNELYY